MTVSRSPLRTTVLLLFALALLYVNRSSAQTKQPEGSAEPGLLFYLSGDRGFDADVAGGSPSPNFLEKVRIIPDGARGPGFECEDKQLMSYRAPGNIYAERGTLSFFWRSRYPVGNTEFPIFRVGYA